MENASGRAWFKDAACILSSCGLCDSAKEYLLRKLWLFNFRASDTYHYKAIKNSKASKGIYFIFSESGELDSLVDGAKIAKSAGYTLVTFTTNKNSTLATISDISIIISSFKNNYLDIAETNFFTAKLIIFIELLFAEYTNIYC